MWLPSSQLSTRALLPKASRRFRGITTWQAKFTQYGRPPAVQAPPVARKQAMTAFRLCVTNSLRSPPFG